MLAGVTIHNFLVVGLLASVFIVLFKFAAARTPVQGVKRFADAI